ncbi:MAG: hypothetical protein A2283_10885 [Lentisphaerae bacterium RIFOXYA12_FULL_48_11]|nr:MAG: hypothetical protein A2283_10885 [Lentisphaerae bacterium RIFOXYA12_FULL_48_11]
MKRFLHVVFSLAILALPSITTPGANNDDNTLSLKLFGSSQSSSELPVSRSKNQSYYFSQAYQAKIQLATPPQPKAFYKSIYPGIDLTCYGDEYQLEYIFSVAPGADYSLIRLLFENIQSVSLSHAGGLRILIPGGEILQNAPIVFMESNLGSRRLDGRYEMGYGGTVCINPGSHFERYSTKQNNTKFNLIPSGGQPGGPDYDFYLSKYESSNDQFLRFLNDAETNTRNPRGSSMFFDKLGNVWINPVMKHNRDELFEMAGSRLSYDADLPIGSRYAHWQTKDGKKPYVNHPVTGVSWFGAVKYCNWLTIESGRTAADCCYLEGTNTFDWAPVTATNWANGTFSDAERQAWLSVKGFRLPMLNCPADTITTNAFGEFYKAAAWGAITNRLFGFGRDSFSGNDANYISTLGITNQNTFPVGYFNGDKYLGSMRTRLNENFYGIFDLSGNAAEWMNDFGTNGLISTRTVCGGSWEDAPSPLTAGKSVSAASTSTFGGFRTTTTYLPVESLRIHILFSFFMDESTGLKKSEEEWPFIIPPLPELPAMAGETPSEYAARGTPDPSMDVIAPQSRTDNIMPDGVTYKPGALVQMPVSPVTEQAGAGQTIPNVVLPAMPPSGEGGKGPGPLSTNTLTISASTPDPTVLIQVSPADISGDTAGSTTFTRDYLYGTTVTLTAPTNSGSASFVQWLQNGIPYSVNPSITVSITADTTMTAVYQLSLHYDLTVTSVTPDPTVTINVSPADAGGNTGGNTTFIRSYLSGSIVTMTAPTNSGTANFQQWLRDGIFYTASRNATIAMVTNITMTAVYVAPPAQYTLEVRSINPSTGVTITVNPPDNMANSDGSTFFTRIYTVGSFATVSAPATAGGNVFQKWQRDGLDATTNLILTTFMNTNHSVTAVYIRMPGPIVPPPQSPGGV